MSGQYLNAITENASRLGMRIQESFSEHTRDLAIARGASSAYLDTQDDKVKNIRKQLDSSSDREKLDAMKRLIALISKGRNVSEYFAQVVKNVASQNLEIRKLVYIYLLRYAEQEPDLALLSINTFQKDLTDSNPLIRAMALRVLSGIKVPMIGSIVVLAIKKCAADVSPYVRKNAALAIPKCFELDSSHTPALIEIITSLLRDKSPLSIGSVAVAFEAVCPTRLDLLHQQYRRLCRILLDADEWGQVDLLNLLLRYARTMLTRPGGVDDIDPDVELLLKSSEPLLQSRNPAVVLAVARAFYYAATEVRLTPVVQPLLRLLSISNEVERVVLAYIILISRDHPSIFAPYYTRFFLRSDDLCQVKLDKIKILLCILNVDNYQPILREFIDYADDPEDSVVTAALRAMGRCARLIPECTTQCLNALISMIRSTHDIVVSSAVLVLKYLVQTQLEPANGSASIISSQSPVAIIAQLARKLDDIKHSQARACVIWLVGQYAPSDQTSAGPDGMADWAPDVLRKAAKGFIHESSIVKLQIVSLAAKLLVLNPTHNQLVLLTRYVLSLARYDLDYDVRDRARMISSLLIGVVPTVNGTSGDEEDAPQDRGGVILRREQVKLVLFRGKAGVVEENTGLDDPNAPLGSIGLITGRPMRSDAILPDWLEEGIDPHLRDSPEDTPSMPLVPSAISSASPQVRSRVPSAMGSPVILTPGGSPRPGSSLGKGPWTNLDKFYADDEPEEEEEEEEEEEDDGEEDGESEGSDQETASGDDVEGPSESGEEESESEDVHESSRFLGDGSPAPT
ncbi:hypothetical protein HGRIS_003726 [Hohenbuehelia grisea]|uniref:Clathrin/coatomer adaptor adaptin-like N-terminal domain-containing protein n=1 Tax=Hohenbuehelia grisea TaxID=104357 RepID=A0ABR3JHX5_9AGAR